jgi:hypothetical protein
MIRYESLTPSIGSAACLWAGKSHLRWSTVRNLHPFPDGLASPHNVTALYPSLSGTVLDRFIPLNRAMRIHVYLGYAMISLVLFATFRSWRSTDPLHSQ